MGRREQRHSLHHKQSQKRKQKAAKAYHDDVWNFPKQGRPRKEVENHVRVVN